MSFVELNTLEQLGRQWSAGVWMQNNSTAKAKEILGKVNETLQAYRPNTFKVYTVFHAYDPYVRTAGLKSGSYASIAGWAASQADGGVAAATEVLACIVDKDLKDLSIPMAALVVIACFAEVGRGYAQDLYKFSAWMQGIKGCGDPATAKVLWGSYNSSFPPSLTYKADQEDFQPDF
jgi:hypothetical protein